MNGSVIAKALNTIEMILTSKNHVDNDNKNKPYQSDN